MQIADLFCGRGNGLRALSSLGFESLSGVDLSEELLASYDGPARLYLGDCPDIRFPDRSLDVVIVQGGLHHLPDPIEDVDRTLRGLRRVLRPTGCLVVVEPWLTPFLSLVHWCCSAGMARRVWGKLDALAAMIEHERETYFHWLSQPEPILARLHAHFVPEHERVAWGKLTFVGTPRPEKRPRIDPSGRTRS